MSGMRHLHFLVVDDDHRIRTHVREALAEAYPDAAFHEAADAEEAVGLAGSTSPSMILLDCHMPGRSGLKALPELRARQPGVPIVMFSAEAPEAYAKGALRAGATAFVSKETGVDDLVRVVRRLTDS
jgi:two-component system invasion response regulator UvrY